MKKILLVAAMIGLSYVAYAQEASEIQDEKVVNTQERGFRPRMKRPTTYEQVDSMRHVLNLDHDQFDKVYSAYEKYNNAVFGENKNRGGGGRPEGPNGGGRGMGPRGGGGRPDGMVGRGPGMRGGGNGEAANMDGNSEARRPNREVDMKKMEETRTKQEETLTKSMQKIFKKSPEQFELWQTIRKQQLEEMFPTPPAQPEAAPDGE